MRDTDDNQVTIDIGPVNRQGQTLTLNLTLQMAVPLPEHDEHPPVNGPESLRG